MREDWIECDLQEVCFSSKGKKPPILENKISEKINVPYINIKAFEKGIIDEYTDGNKCNLCEDGDLLMVWDGARAGLSGKARKGAVGSTLMKIEEVNGIEKQYLSYFLLSLYTKINTNPRGVGIPHVEPRILWYSKLLIVSSPIQRAIVSKIEALFSDLDNGIANFKKAQEQLKIYRQAVLKKAFEGGFSITNEELRITSEKSEQSNNQKNHSSDNLPNGWKWVKLKDISELITDGDHQAPPKSEEGISFITISNVNKETNKINFNNTFKVKSEYYYGLKDHRRPKIGDILYTVTGSFGIPIIIDFEKEFCFQRHIGLIRPLTSVNQKYLYYLLQTKAVFNQASETATGTAQKTVALSSLRNFTIPYCDSLQEQTQIVQEIESRLSVTGNLEFVIP